MISVLSSYKVDPTLDADQILPELSQVCEELYSRGFAGIDIVLNLSDLINACKNRTDEEAAQEIEHRIRTEVEHWAQEGKNVPLKVCALATNFPGISSVDKDEADWFLAVRYLAICLVVAHRLGTRVIEIVAGSRIHTKQQDNKLLLTSLDDAIVIRKIRERFAQGVCDAFIRAEKLLDIKRWPEVGLAIEIEPDVTALARNLDDAYLLLKEVDNVLVRTRSHSKWKHFGINLDWGHLLLVCDSALIDETQADTTTDETQADTTTDETQADTTTDETQADTTTLESYINKLNMPMHKQRIMHVHVSDHFPGAHRADAPIGSFRPLSAYWPLMRIHSDLLQNYDTRHNSKSTTRNPYFSGALGIELEARQDISYAVKCRDALITLGKIGSIPLTLETDKDRLRLVEQAIAQAGKSEGWLEGINRTIFDALSDWKHRTTRIPNKYAVLNDTTLDRIRDFLSSSEPDARTKLAIDLAYEVLSKLGAEILVFWLTDLLDEEWGKNFYKQYRDHTIHSVYVYLLGLYLYAVSPEIQDLINQEDGISPSMGPALIIERGEYKIPTFFAKWAVAALTHDIGYPFEAGGLALTQARNKLRETFWRFPPHLCVLRKRKSIDREKISTYLVANQALLKGTELGREINSQFDALGSVFYLKKDCGKAIEERIGEGLQQFDDQLIDIDLEKAFFNNCGAGATLNKVFDLYRNTKPKDKARQPFLDHGFMSAAVLHELVRLCQWWAEGTRAQTAITNLSGGAHPLQTMGKAIKEWKEKFLANKGDGDVKQFLLQVYFAIIIHNIAPERKLANKTTKEEEPGLLYSSKNRTPVILKDLRDLHPDYSAMPVLPFMLGICDLLHEWHRFGFVNPLKLKHETLSPLEVVSWPTTIDGKKIICFKYNTTEKVEGRSFTEYKIDDLNRRFGDYWTNFITIK